MAWRIGWWAISGLLTYLILVEIVFLRVVHIAPEERRRRRPFHLILAIPLLLNLGLSLDGVRCEGAVRGMYEAMSRDDAEAVRACFDEVIRLDEEPILNAPLTIDWILGPRPWNRTDPSQLGIEARFDPLDPFARWVMIAGDERLCLVRLRWAGFRWKIEAVFLHRSHDDRPEMGVWIRGLPLPVWREFR